jgi:hypothetical protein
VGAASSRDEVIKVNKILAEEDHHMLNFKPSPQQLKLQKKAHSAGLINGDIPRKYGGKGWGLVEEECPYCFFPESAFKKAS